MGDGKDVPIKQPHESPGLVERGLSQQTNPVLSWSNGVLEPRRIWYFHLGAKPEHSMMVCPLSIDVTCAPTTRTSNSFHGSGSVLHVYVHPSGRYG